MDSNINLAVLIDGDNIPSAHVKEMMEEIAKYGNPTIKRIYGDWTKPHLSKWKNLLLENAITPIQQYGYTTGKKEIIELLRQRSRPYLFSNSLAPAIVGASLKVFEMISKDTSLRDKLEENTKYFKEKMIEAGFDIVRGDSAIVPVMLYDAKLAQEMANQLLKEGIYVIGFFFPVVPKGKARIRVQLSAAHNKKHLDKAIQAFIKTGKMLKII